MKTSTRLVFTATALLIPSFYVVLKGAGDEPYIRFRWADALVQIGVASALITLWLMLAGEIVKLAWRKEIHRGWLSLLGLSGLALFFLYHAPVDYLSDLGYWGVALAQ